MQPSLRGLALSVAQGAATLTIAMLTGCDSPGSNLPLLPSPTLSETRLAPGDEVRIITFGEDQLTGTFRVTEAGAVALPLLGPTRAAGLTTQALEQEISQGLKERQLLRDPSVSVEVATARPIYVLGEVNKPGAYPYVPGMTVVTAVAVAGGYTYRAIEDYAGVVRSVDGRTVEGRAERQGLLQPGDVVTVYERRF